MNFTVIIILFLLFSFIGWILDSVFSTLYTGKVTNSGYFEELPLCPMYGVGGLVLYYMTYTLIPYPWYMTILITGFLLSIVEYIGGWFCVVVLRERLWDYSDKKWNLHGHVDLLHFIFWIGIAAFFYFYLFPRFILLEQFLKNAVHLSMVTDESILFLFCLGAIILTYTRRKKRLQRLTTLFMKKTISFSKKIQRKTKIRL